VIDLVDVRGRVLAQEGEKVHEGHRLVRHGHSKGEGAGAFLPPTPIM
jgi:hypothetical protein